MRPDLPEAAAAAVAALIDLDAFRKARRAADKAKVPFKTSNVSEWRRFLETHMACLSDTEILEAIAELCDARHLTISDAYIIIGSNA